MKRKSAETTTTPKSNDRRRVLKASALAVAAGLLVGGGLGTLLGVVIAMSVGAGVNGYLTAQGLEGVRVVASMPVVVSGVLGAAALAVVAGVVPARRAAHLPAREAVGSL